jgi:hypothetical protein
VYQNTFLRCSISFAKTWDITTDPNTMSKAGFSFAKTLQKQGAELLFLGTTRDGLQGVRGMAANQNFSLQNYASLIRESNKDAISADSGLVNCIINNTPMIKWVYHSNGFKYVEFFIVLDTHDIRVAFWAEPKLFDRFFPEYIKIISSFEPY